MYNQHRRKSSRRQTMVHSHAGLHCCITGERRTLSDLEMAQPNLPCRLQVWNRSLVLCPLGTPRIHGSAASLSRKPVFRWCCFTADFDLLAPQRGRATARSKEGHPSPSPPSLPRPESPKKTSRQGAHPPPRRRLRYMDRGRSTFFLAKMFSE